MPRFNRDESSKPCTVSRDAVCGNCKQPIAERRRSKYGNYYQTCPSRQCRAEKKHYWTCNADGSNLQLGESREYKADDNDSSRSRYRPYQTSNRISPPAEASAAVLVSTPASRDQQHRTTLPSTSTASGEEEFPVLRFIDMVVIKAKRQNKEVQSISLKFGSGADSGRITEYQQTFYHQ